MFEKSGIGACCKRQVADDQYSAASLAEIDFSDPS
jgi:hypothetical protein